MGYGKLFLRKEFRSLLNIIYKGDDIMATESIFANFEITDKRAAKRFIRALEKSSKQDTKPISCHYSEPTDKEIQEMFGKN